MGLIIKEYLPELEFMLTDYTKTIKRRGREDTAKLKHNKAINRITAIAASIVTN